MNKFIRWVIGSEIIDYWVFEYKRDVHYHLNEMAKCRNHWKEYVMQKKLRELGYEVVNTFPKAELVKTIDFSDPKPLELHKTGYWEVRKMHHEDKIQIIE